MPPTLRQFDQKNFNPEVFARYVDRIPKLRLNRMIQAGIFSLRPDLAALFPAQTGGYFATIPIKDYLKGNTVNFDGVTNITTNTQQTFQQGIIVKGEAAGFTETDFSYSVTGVDFMSDVANQLSGWRESIDEDLLFSIVKGIFSMTGAANLAFVNNHTHDISGETEPNFGPTTLNTAMQKASGDNRSQFAVAIVHSTIMTSLENQQLINFLTHTDSNGITSSLRIGELNGRLIVEYDGVPFDEATGIATSYVFGREAFTYFDAPVLVPYEMSREPALNGGKSFLWTRFRRCFAPRGISFTASSLATASPEHAELENGANWELVHNQQAANKKYFPHKAIPIARIITKEA